MPFIMKHLTKLQLKLDTQRGTMNKRLLLIYNMTAHAFMRIFRSKQKGQDKIGPLEGNDGNIITEGYLMA